MAGSLETGGLGIPWMRGGGCFSSGVEGVVEKRVGESWVGGGVDIVVEARRASSGARPIDGSARPNTTPERRPAAGCLRHGAVMMGPEIYAIVADVFLDPRSHAVRVHIEC
ncbi:MAG TPA: hypothetical protein VGW38_15390 [Chloroflexota bacterium]|nr:hypothetical protein [Chloroflexota bacterium]